MLVFLLAIAQLKRNVEFGVDGKIDFAYYALMALYLTEEKRAMCGTGNRKLASTSF